MFRVPLSQSIYLYRSGIDSLYFWIFDKTTSWHRENTNHMAHILSNSSTARPIICKFSSTATHERSRNCDIQTYIWLYTSPNEILNMVIHSNAFMQFRLEWQCCKWHKDAHHPTKCNVINDVILFPAVYCRIYCPNFWSYPIRRCVTKACALECLKVQFVLSNYRPCVMWFGKSGIKFLHLSVYIVEVCLP